MNNTYFINILRNIMNTSKYIDDTLSIYKPARVNTDAGLIR